MKRFQTSIQGMTVLGLAMLLTGCRGPLPKVALSSQKEQPESESASEDDAAVKLVSASDDQPMTFTDSEKLRYGTGQMDPDAPTSFQMTPSGLRYRILRRSAGRKPAASDTVTVNYRGWLDSGKEFDSSYDRGAPISFPLTGVIKGWTEGMQLVGEGGMIELWVPAGLGYGQQGSPPNVPPNATLHFVVELIKIK